MSDAEILELVCSSVRFIKNNHDAITLIEELSKLVSITI